MAASIYIKDITFQPTVSQYPLDGKGVIIELVGIPDTEIVDLEWLSSDPTLFTFSSSGSQSSFDSGVIDYSAVFNANGSGRTTFTVRDRNSGNEGSKTVYFECSEVSGWPRMWWDPNPVVVAATNAPYVSDNTILRMSGCSLGSSNVPVRIPCTSGDAQDWNVWSADTPVLSISYVSSADTFVGNFQHIHSTTGGTRWHYEYMTVPDTDGALHIIPAILEQSSGTTPTGNIYCDWASAWTPDTPCNGFSDNDAQLHVENCTLDDFSFSFQPISGDPSFTCDVARTHSTQNWEPLGGIRARVSGNTTNETRVGNLGITFYDTSGNTYYQEMTITQAPCGSGPTPDRWIYINPSARTLTAQQASTFVNIYASGCSLDPSFVSYTISGDSFVTGVSNINEYISSTEIACYVSKNSGQTQREAYVNFVFKDTSGNSYTDSLKITQSTGRWMEFSPASLIFTSAATTSSVTITAVNCVFDHIELTGSPSTFATTSLTGNQIIFSVPKNETDQPWRQTFFRYRLYDTSGNTYSVTILVGQEAGGGPAAITTNLSDENVTSGSNSISGIISTTSCTFDHLTYMTGGSIPGMVVTTNGDQLYISVPANNTNQSRVGYVYLTFYDTDAYTYQQTITIRQATGSGPGPGPDPDTGYVYTSLTISDNEQHRFFLEAQPGVVYSAAGQYYKTIKACEARYSLYYVNSYGGVDVLPFRGGGQKKTDNLTRYNYTRSFRNNTLEFENVNYMTEIKPAWELKTGYMTDEQSKRMHELVESTIVYLYDAEEKEYTPVVMTDKKLEYKTFHNQGKKFYNYTVNVEESQSKERR